MVLNLILKNYNYLKIKKESKIKNKLLKIKKNCSIKSLIFRMLKDYHNKWIKEKNWLKIIFIKLY
jgi:hypothetical protein